MGGSGELRVESGERSIAIGGLSHAARGVRRGLTLLEVLLALGLTVLLLSGVFGFYATALRTREEARAYTQDVRLFRSILSRMAEEIRHATATVPGDGIGFRGDRRKITIVRVGLPEKYAFDEYDLLVDKPPPAQLDLRRTTYELLWDDDKKDEEGVRSCYGLWRTEQRTFDPNPRFVVTQVDAAAEATGGETLQVLGPQPEGELYAPEIKYLEFAYFDGAQWRDRWQYAAEGEEGGGAAAAGAAGPMNTGYALPQAVRITIGTIRDDPDNEMFDLDRWQDLEAHPTLMSSRQYGVADSMARQEGGSNP